MRLRHRKWADSVFEENKDIARNLSDFDPESVKEFPNLEIGSGCGGFLQELSFRNPEERFLGVEINKNAFALAVKKLSAVKDNQKNFLLLNAPIERLFPLIQDEQLSHIYINFPDPWPKKKQQHRRLSYPTMLKEYYRLLKKGGKLYFRTDNADLFTDSVNYFKEVDLYDIEVIEPLFSENVDYLPPTEYERKFREKGVDIHLLIATKR